MGTIADRNAQVFTFRESQMKAWRQEAVGFRKRQNDNPYGTTQQSEIQNEGLDPEAFINVFGSLNDTWVGTMMSNKSSFSVAPKINNTPKAYLWQAVILDILKLSYFPLIKEKALNDAITCGVGFLGVDKAPPWRKNIYNTIVKYMDFENCLWPITHEDPFMQDIEDFTYFCKIPLKTALVKYGFKFDPKQSDAAKEEMSALPDSLKRSDEFQNMGAEENRLVPYLEVCTKEWKKYIQLIDYSENKNSIERRFDIEYDSSKDIQNNIMSFFLKHTKDKEKATMLSSGYKGERVKELTQERCVKYRSIGCMDLETEILTTKLIPVVPLYYKNIQGAYPIGVYKQHGGLNNMINQALYIEFLTAKENASSHWEIPEGTVSDEDQFIEAASTIHGILKTRPQTLGSGAVVRPQKISSQASPGSMMAMIPFIKQAIDDGVGIDDIVRGVYSGTPPSGDAVQQLQQNGGIRLNLHALRDQMAMAQLAKIVFDYAKKLTDFDKVTTMFVGDNVLYKNLVDSGVAEDMGDNNVSIRINSRKGNEVENALKNTDDEVDITYVSAPFMETQRRQLQAGLSMMMQQGGPDAVSSLTQPFFEVMDIPQAQQIASQIGSYKNLQDEINVLTEDLRKAKDEVKNLGQQLIRAKSTTEVTREAQRMKSIFESLRNDMQLSLKEGKIDAEVAEDNMKKLDTVIEDLDKLIFNQPSMEQTVDTAIGG